MDEFKPCPFCGGEPRCGTWSRKDYHVVECENCGFELDFRHTKEALVKDWNSRYIPEGYAIVPLEPTEELMDIIETVVDRHESLEDIYKAMIKAANKESE